MWKRHLLFLISCLAGFSALGANLLRTDRVRTPRHFHSEQATATGLSDVVDRIDGEFESVWAASGLQQAPKAPSLQIVRRLALGLMGTVPSLEEIRALQLVPPDQQIDWWLSRVFEDRRYADYIAERLARAYVGTEDGPFLLFRRRRFVSWISDQLHEGKTGYGELVSHIIADQGLWTDKPSVNFVTVTSDQNRDGNPPDPIRLAARTTRAFLGVRIDCLQCHDDRLGKVALGTATEPREGTQIDFHELAAFFGGVGNNGLTGIRDEPSAAKDRYRTRLLHAENEQIVEPRVPFQRELWREEGTLRQQLAAWVTHVENRAFARMAVNRVWALMFGKPLVQPIDDIPLFGPFPPGLESLADDFVANGYDLRRLIRLIAHSEVFQADSRAAFELQPMHEDLWAVFPLIRLRPEQVAGSVLQAASLNTIDAQSNILWQLLKFGQQNDFVQAYGDMGEDEFTDRGGTIPQRLLMMNGDLIKERTEQNIVLNASSRIALFAPDHRTAIESAYLAVLTRRPSSTEAAHFEAEFAEARTAADRLQAVEDLYWTLMNSTEFLWNH
ncbi:MAG: DUF1553 domain-containing protein [Planctomycetes bacterium]|nr:DUF1553 domain-containing protein [Planctomycetota bacterium]